jgi:chemotaxis protein CheD
MAEVNKFKFADTAVPEMIRLLTDAGASRYALQAKLAGGAHMFVNSYQTDVMGIGKRNVDICLQLLQAHRIPVAAQDTGGSIGRSIEFNCEDSMLMVRTVAPKSLRLI